MFKELAINDANLEIEIANTPLKRSLGLMYRKELSPGAGMIFVFPEDMERSFWMKDTHIPLSIAYINQDGVILNIEDMEPLSLSGVPSSGPCRYALEVNRGWFEENGIQAGDQIEGISEESNDY
ncbi:MAG TPA: DUF192 domain-containing protein [Nitrospinaceae bacterium]|jgi:uncharacterized membrane protein (UPF0127 family)|nr:DUF192 domain-containing protein [Nitrospinaceae bacterium]